MAKTKALISFAVTAKLICVFVFAYAKSRFSHDAAQFITAIRPGLEVIKPLYYTFKASLILFIVVFEDDKSGYFLRGDKSFRTLKHTNTPKSEQMT